MSDTISAREIIERLVKQSGLKKKQAVEILRAIPEIIEEGLQRDDEVRVKGLGTFRLKWTRGKVGRNPKTGERIDIPAHNRPVFIPEQSFKDYINRDNRLLSYKIIPSATQLTREEETILQPPPEIIPEPEPEPEPEQEPEPEHQHGPEAELLMEDDEETEPEPHRAKHRVHWIIPVALSVIAILIVIFYFRNFYQGEKSAVRSQQSAVTSQQSVVSSQQSAVNNENSDLITPDSKLSTPARTTSVLPSGGQNSELRTLTAGSHLFRLAREIYGNPYLWVLIYKENLDKIPDPDLVDSGVELTIPALEGSPEKLTKNDSLAVSEGYRLLYEYYKARNDPRAGDFQKAMNRY
jgi:nucleoid DNA-binding protein